MIASQDCLCPECVANRKIAKLEEALNKIKNLPRYTFLSPLRGGVRRFKDKSGNHIEHYEVIKIIEAIEYE